MELAVQFLTLVQQNNHLWCYDGANAWTPEIGKTIQQLWSSNALKKLYYQHDNKVFQVNDSADYFFDSIDRLIQPDYLPTVQDALRVRLRSTGIEESTFRFGEDYFRVLDVGGQRSERTKWKACFDCVTSVLFIAGLSEYDQYLRENESVNRLDESLRLYEDVVNSEIFKDVSVILFLNKTDLLERKLKVVPLSQFYPSFQGGDNMAEACKFLEYRFREVSNPDRKSTFVHFTCAIDTSNITTAISNVRRQVLLKNSENYVL